MRKLLVMLAAWCAAGTLPAAAQQLVCGRPVDGTFPKATFTYPGSPGEIIWIRLISDVAADVTITPEARKHPWIYFLYQFNLDVEATYQITVGRTDGKQDKEPFSVVLGSTKCAPAKPLTCGLMVTDELSTPGGSNFIKLHQFQGAAGERVSIRTAPAEFEYSVFAILYGPAGEIVSPIYANPNTRWKDYRLDADGLYSLMLTVSPPVRQMPYSIGFIRVNTPCNAKPLTCGDTVDDSIGQILGANAYTLAASSRDVYLLRVARTDLSSLNPILEIRDSRGQPVQVPADRGKYQFTAGSDTYTIFASDGGYTQTGKFSLSVARVNRPCGAQPLACGGIAEGRVEGPLRFKTLSFDAQGGDKVLVRLLRSDLGNGFRPSVDIYDPRGVRVDFLDITNKDVAKKVLTAPESGSYTMLVADADSIRTGAFAVSLQWLNRPCNAASLSCGAPAVGAIDRPLKVAAYTYAAAPGDAFSVRLINSGSLQPAVDVYDPAGTQVGTPLPGNTKGADVRASAGGNYLILVGEESVNQGAFAIASISTRAGCGTAPPQGQPVSGAISGAAPFGVYVLPAAAGDALQLRLAGVSPGFLASMDLYGPDGARLEPPSSVAISRRLRAGGNHTVIVGASDPRKAGNFAFAWQRLNSPVGSPLACGQTAAGALTPDAQFRYYLLNGNEGDQLRLQFTRITEGLGAKLELFDPAGNPVPADRKADISGDYLAVVSPETAAAQVGAFSLAFQKPNSPCAAAPLACGQTVLRTADVPGQFDAFSFAGNPGDNMTLRISSRTGPAPIAELYDPSGSLLQSGSVPSLSRTLASGDPYTLLVRSPAAGSFRVSLQRGNEECAVDDKESPTIRLRRPTGGEVVEGRSLLRIAWESDDNIEVVSHSVRYSADGGRSFTTIQDGVSGAAQTFDWVVPANVAPSRSAMVQVTAMDKAGNSQTATSDAFAVIGSGFTENSSVSYVYDALNRIVEAGYSDGRKVYYTYDAAGNLVQITVQ